MYDGLHAFGATGHLGEVVLGPRREVGAHLPLQQMQEAADHADGFLEIVRGDVGELLELGVGALKLVGQPFELLDVLLVGDVLGHHQAMRILALGAADADGGG